MKAGHHAPQSEFLGRLYREEDDQNFGPVVRQVSGCPDSLGGEHARQFPDEPGF